MENKLIAVIGPTAAGKTTLGVKLAIKFNGEIISADSRQVYKYLNLGTGKDLEEYSHANHKIDHHLIDIIDPRDEFNLFFFKQKFIEAYKEIINRKKLPVMVGGTGMYISSIIQDYKLPEGDHSLESFQRLNKLSEDELREAVMMIKPLNNETDLSNKGRMINAILHSKGEKILTMDFNPCIIGVHFEREELKERITARLKQRLESGMIEEVKSLLENVGVPYERLLELGLEYKFIAMQVKGELTYNEMFQKLNSAIHAFAKRQMTWYRKMEREGVKINWISKGNYEQAEEIVKKFLGYEN